MKGAVVKVDEFNKDLKGLYKVTPEGTVQPKRM